MDTFLHEQRNQEVSRLSSFLLGAAASAIAFAMHETSNRPVHWSLTVVGLAVLAWAAAFACGVLCSHAKQAALGMNVGMNTGKANNSPEAEIENLRADFKKYNRRASNLHLAELWLLLVGALLYTAGQAWFIFSGVGATVAH